jgi:hypothetical protein
LLGVGETEKEAVANLESEVTDFTNWLAEKYKELSVDEISSNLPEYRNAIFDFNMRNFF